MNKFKIRYFKYIFVALLLILLIFPIIISSSIKNLSAHAQAYTFEDVDNKISVLNDKTEYDIEQVAIELFGNVKVKSSEYLYNLDDSADYIYIEFENNGYAVFLKQTMELLEYSPQGTINYPDINSYKYYGGPSFYLLKRNNHFINTVSQECLYIEKETVQTFSNSIRKTLLRNYNTRSNKKNIKFNYDLKNKFVTEKLHEYETNNNFASGKIPELNINSLIKITDGTYIPNYRYFAIGPKHGINSTGTCGAVAAQLMLSYHNYYSDRRLIANEYLNGTLSNSSLNPNYCTDPMSMTADTLGTRGYYENGSDDKNSYFQHVVNNIPANATTSQVKTGINNIINIRNNDIGGSINYTLNSLTGG